MHGRGVCVAGGHVGVACMAGGVRGGGVHAMHSLLEHYEIRSVNARPVCILLECILAKVTFFTQNFRNVNHTICKR